MSDPTGWPAAPAVDPRRTFRFNPAYELVPFDRLTPDEWSRIGADGPEPGMAGVLMPSVPTLSVKTVCPDTAALLGGLRSPGALPEEARAEFRRDGAVLLRLVLDSVLEVEVDGTFVSGPGALDALHVPAAAPRTEHVLARLAMQALRYGQALEVWRAPALSARLYFYNRIPASPAWARRIGTERGIERHLGMEPGTHLRRLLDSCWRSVPPPPDNPGWFVWRCREPPREATPYKLYLSPHPDALGDALSVAVPVLAGMGAPAFKLGRDMHGILRPDKLVVYFPTRPALRRVGDALAAALAGVRPHGVPFTAPVDGAGLLSWGMDPPRSERFSKWQGRSWRRWVTDRLAVALLRAKGAPDSVGREPWQFALERIGAEGVDPATWAPACVDWASGGGDAGL
jgi:hypothetical protein